MVAEGTLAGRAKLHTYLIRPLQTIRSLGRHLRDTNRWRRACGCAPFARNKAAVPERRRQLRRERPRALEPTDLESHFGFATYIAFWPRENHLTSGFLFPYFTNNYPGIYGQSCLEGTAAVVLGLWQVRGLWIPSPNTDSSDKVKWNQAKQTKWPHIDIQILLFTSPWFLEQNVKPKLHFLS